MTNEMTAKEAVKQIKENCYFASISEKTKQALDKAIQALEQEDILEKIKAEINILPCGITSMREIYVNRDKVIDILDKYKAESEEICEP